MHFCWHEVHPVSQTLTRFKCPAAEMSRWGRENHGVISMTLRRVPMYTSPTTIAQMTTRVGSTIRKRFALLSTLSCFRSLFSFLLSFTFPLSCLMLYPNQPETSSHAGTPLSYRDLFFQFHQQKVDVHRSAVV